MNLNRVMKILILLLIFSTGYGYASTSAFHSLDNSGDVYLMTDELFSLNNSLEITHSITQNFTSIDSISLEMVLYDDDDGDDDISLDLGVFVVSINDANVDIDIFEVDGSDSSHDTLYMNDLKAPILSETGPTTVDLILTITPILLSDFHYVSSTLTIEGTTKNNPLDDPNNPVHAPIPSGILLFASSIVGLLGIRKR